MTAAEQYGAEAAAAHAAHQKWQDDVQGQCGVLGVWDFDPVEDKGAWLRGMGLSAEQAAQAILVKRYLAVE